MPLTFDPNFIDFDEQVTSPSTPEPNVVRIYIKSDGKFYRKNDAGVETEIGNVTEFISALFTEGSAPTTPAVGKVIIYAKADGKVYSKDDAGVETLMSGGESRVGLIATGDLTGLSSATISGIPAIYTHLRLYIYARSGHGAEDFITVRVGNGVVDTSTNYGRSSINVTGTTVTGTSDNGAASNILTNCSANFNSATNRFSATIIDFPDYRASAHKVGIYTHRASIGTAVTDQKFVIGGAHWLSTSPIDAIGLSLISGGFASGSKYSLIGIKAE